MLLDYQRRTPPVSRSRSSAEIMDRDAAAPLVRGRAVIVGIAPTGERLFSTPFDNGFDAAHPIYGIAMHAYLADQLIREARDGDRALAGVAARWSRHLDLGDGDRPARCWPLLALTSRR